jgi:hypothetical protein
MRLRKGTEICPTEQDVTKRKRNYHTTDKPGIEERLFHQPKIASGLTHQSAIKSLCFETIGPEMYATF